MARGGALRAPVVASSSSSSAVSSRRRRRRPTSSSSALAAPSALCGTVTVVCAVVLLVFVIFAAIFTESMHLHHMNRPPPPAPVYPANPKATFLMEPFHTVSSMSKKWNHARDVTAVLQVSVDRLERVATVARFYTGPISCAVYIRNETTDVAAVLAVRDAERSVRERVDFHLLHFNRTRYPVNNLRNLAIDSARTDYVFVLDADFVPNPRLHEDLVAAAGDVPPETRRAFVVPAFESDLKDADAYPKDKGELEQMVDADVVRKVNERACPKCHGPTRYAKFFNDDKNYRIEYHWIFEPYLMYNRSVAPPFPAYLKGYGFDKNSHSWLLAVMGHEFWVMANSFIIHMNHAETSWDGPKDHRKQIWDSLSEVCEMFVRVRKEYGVAPHTQIFDEPTPSNCMSTDHW